MTQLNRATLTAFTGSFQVPSRLERRNSPRCCASQKNTPSSSLSANITPKRPHLSFAERVKDRLERDLPELFADVPTDHYDLYTDDVIFEDPLTKFRGISKYKSNISFLKNSRVFSGTILNLYDITVVSDTLVRTRWELSMTANFPWTPRVSFTGTSDYVLDVSQEKVVRHVDYWDILEDSSYFSLPAVSVLVSQILPGRKSTSQSPYYRRFRCSPEYEIRSYGTLNFRRGARGDYLDQLLGRNVSKRPVDCCINQLVEKLPDGTLQQWIPVNENPDMALDCIAVVVANTPPKTWWKSLGSSAEKLSSELSTSSVAQPTGRTFLLEYKKGVNSEKFSTELVIEVIDVSLSAEK